MIGRSIANLKKVSRGFYGGKVRAENQARRGDPRFDISSRAKYCHTQDGRGGPLHHGPSGARKERDVPIVGHPYTYSHPPNNLGEVAGAP